MPYPFVLPTTSAFSFSSSFSCDTHPSLPLNASTYRGVVRDTLKKHKRLPPASQSSNLSLVVSSLNDYLRHLLVVDAGLNRSSSRGVQGGDVNVELKPTPLAIEWRPILSAATIPVPGKEPPRVKIKSLEHEIFFTLSTLATALTLQARAALQPLYVTSVAPPGPEQRQAALQGATRLLLDAASIHDYLSSRSSLPTSSSAPPAPCADISPATVSAQRSLALAEATLLAVLKDDPYPAVIAQDRNALDTDWMFRAPEIPKVRAHLFARLCLAASEHAAQAAALCHEGRGGTGSGALSDGFVRYIEDLRRTSRAKACRFFGIDAELGGQTGTAIGWLRAGLQELGGGGSGGGRDGGGSGGGGGGSGEKNITWLTGRLRKEWSERREDKKVEKSSSWGADAGRLEETRVIEMLDTKWSKQNDTMNTQLVPPASALLAQMPSGRNIHKVTPYEPPTLDPVVLEAMRAPPGRSDEFGKDLSSDDEAGGNNGDRVSSNTAVGVYPYTRGDYVRSASTSSYY